MNTSVRKNHRNTYTSHTSVDESAIPFQVSAKSAVIGAGYSPSDITSAFQGAVRNEVSEQHKKELPVARYDMLKEQAYLEYADGAREYVGR